VPHLARGIDRAEMRSPGRSAPREERAVSICSWARTFSIPISSRKRTDA
jgi:hypothetical protein